MPGDLLLERSRGDRERSRRLDDEEELLPVPLFSL